MGRSNSSRQGSPISDGKIPNFALQVLQKEIMKLVQSAVFYERDRCAKLALAMKLSETDETLCSEHYNQACEDIARNIRELNEGEKDESRKT